MINTLRLAQDLGKAFPPEQAEALAQAFAQQDEQVTKADLELGLEKLRTDLTRWIVGALLVNFFGISGLMITLIKVIR